MIVFCASRMEILGHQRNCVIFAITKDVAYLVSKAEIIHRAGEQNKKTTGGTERFNLLCLISN